METQEEDTQHGRWLPAWCFIATLLTAHIAQENVFLLT